MGELSEREDNWLRRATAAAIAAACKIAVGGAINKNTPVGRLSDIEWGWIVAGAIFAWIATRAEQATSEGCDIELAVRTGLSDPNPWDAGAVPTILPALSEMPGIDWSLPLAEWSREQMIAFLLTALDLVRGAMAARDVGGSVTNPSGAGIPDDPIAL